MSAGWLATKVISAFLLPPLNLIILGGIGILLLPRAPRLGRRLLILSWVLAYSLSTLWVGRTLLQTLEYYPPLRLADAIPPADAIVVLSGGIYCNAPEYGDDTVSGSTTDRLRYAARLHRATGKPIFAAGGKLYSKSHSALMREFLETDFHIPVQWIEEESTNTSEHVVFGGPLLRAQGIHRIYLVTHASHMLRAASSFERGGFEVVPAPTGFATTCQLTVLDFLPHPSGLEMSANALHEWIGQVWYALKR